MLNISGVTVQTQIYESANSIVYRGIWDSDSQPIIRKILKENYPTPQELARYRTEYQITQSLNVPGVVKVYDLQKYQNTLVMFVEDFGGESLKHGLSERTWNLEEFLHLAIAITEALGQIHGANIIHKDINPSNIVFNPNTRQVKIIDFGISTQLTRENTTLKNPNILEGTLPYLSPEQTGRMNRCIDYRSDFYSLGVTFYELLTHRLPFETTDPLELVHCHIAKQPVTPTDIDANIPPVLSDIILKLMAKTAEERYQNAYGLKADLEECLRQNNADIVLKFSLGRHDISDKFQLPQKLYGRESEIQSLLAAFAGSSIQSKLMLIGGYSGIGKSALVQELYKPITEKRGYFISGKFDQYQRNIPYSAIVRAFQGLVKQLLMESEAQLNQWRENLLAAVGVNGQVIVEVIPEIELIIGPQSEVVELGPNESQNRFNLVFQNFIKVFTQQEHPLALFIDDLQWADGASLKLMQLLMAGRSPGLFLIGAYRDNEVSAAHPLMLTLDEIAKTGAIIQRIALAPLDLETIAKLIGDTLNCDGQTVQPLAELVQGKTGGNPFFMNEFLKSLYTEELLDFDRQTLRWEWDLEQIQARGFTDNVVELMVDKIQKLPEETQELLQLAACTGNQFDLKFLGLICEKSLAEMVTDLQSAVTESLVMPLGNLGELALVLAESEFLTPDPTQTQQKSLQYKFGHDRIQQAAYSLIDEVKIPYLHRKIGDVILQNTPKNKQEEKIFDIVNQLNFGIGLMSSQAEKNELAELNLIAGKKAKLSTAYQPALNYLQVGIELLGTHSWQDEYALTLSLYEEATEVAYLNTDFALMDQWVETVVAKAKTVLDKVKVYEVKIQAGVSQSKFNEALDIGLEVLSLFGIKLPRYPKKIDILLGLIRTKLTIGVRPIASLGDLPPMTQPEIQAIMGILSKLNTAIYFSAPLLFPLAVFQQVNLSIKWGNTSESAYAYSCYGLILCGIGDIESGYQFGQLALNFLKRLNTQKVKSRTGYLVHSFVKHWKDPVQAMLNPMLEAYTVGLETGDLEFAAYSAFHYCYYSFLIGSELTQLESDMATYAQVILETGQERTTDGHQIFYQAVLNLLGKAENPCHLMGSAFDEQVRLPILESRKDRSTIFCLYFNKLILCVLFGEVHEAIANADKAQEYIDAVPATLLLSQVAFYDSLARLAGATDAPRSQKNSWIHKVLRNQKKIKKWMHYAPQNNSQKYWLVEAELCRVQGKDAKAMEYYDKAIKLAQENGYLHELAIAYELAAKFYLSKGKEKELTAIAYMQQARYSYQIWGASTKVKDLETRYGQFFIARERVSTHSTTNSNVTSTGSNHNLDIATVMKASQAISGEVLLEKLLSSLMKILIENAGAQRGYLILSIHGELLIEAAGEIEDERVTVLQSISVGNCQTISKSIVNYVARTQETVVLNDATCSGNFTSDSYIQQAQPKSILCAPLIDRGQLVSIVYLENNSTTGAFTPKRVEVLQLLSGQVAISIENARLYQTLEEKVKQRTAQLANANAEITILNERLKAENIRMGAELDVTRRLQKMLLPNQSELDAIEGLDIAGFMEPADEVGGDYYDVLKSGDRIKIAIGDVTGHGLQSGVVMMMAQTAVRTLLEGDFTDPVQFLDVINRTIYKNVQRMNSDKNMTLVLLDYQEGKLTLSGQHEEAIVMRADGTVECIDTVDLGFPIALIDEISDFVSTTEIRLNPGDVVVLYTDGITEAVDSNLVQYGLEPIIESIRHHLNGNAREICQGVIEDVRRHIGGQKIYDDITLIVLKQK
ncbi:AAA family ATPase [Phormidium pseudopriestleyi FRX01]|uniref:AAA family ATPase n=1 Tax=Phormidium pseudopriestleyi FRX01 TaxID=1759528 RepID=A0ABS3FYT2_9CYAN|nr:AAA family ATPase [Phormidium pseudopriestleyi]MBO0352293.1 AAA family ATPase [Phormidium pseudopriestleyi FRX01]